MHIRRSDPRKHLPQKILHRANAQQEVSRYSRSNNSEAIEAAKRLEQKRLEFEKQNSMRKIVTPNKSCWQMLHDIIQARGLSKPHFCNLTGLDEVYYRRVETNPDTKPSKRAIVAVACGLDIDLDTTNKLLQLAGHAFEDSDEDNALKFCIKGADAIAAGLNADGIPAQKGTHWSSTTIRGMLENEKYIGDAIFQKTFTDGQFNRHRNVGQKEQYLATDHHEAIISREDYEAAAALVAQRGSEKGAVKGSRKYQNRYCFSGKIICGECGGTFKRRIHTSTGGKYAAWCCTTHIEDKTRCSMRFIRDDDLKVAFITMLNKLIFGHKFILRPYLKALQSTSGDEGLKRIQHLEQMLEQNTEQRETLTKLMAQGYIDQILFNQENNALLAQADGFRADIQAINGSMTGDTSKVVETEKLLHFAERGSMLAEFDDLLFTKFVYSVRVDSRQQVSFVLKCGLTFKERIGE